MDHAELHAELTAEVTSWGTFHEAAGKALLGILDIHRPNTVNHIEPCEVHRWREDMTAADFSTRWHETCDDCTSTPYVECRVNDDSYRGTPCRELTVIAEAFGIPVPKRNPNG